MRFQAESGLSRAKPIRCFGPHPETVRRWRDRGVRPSPNNADRLTARPLWLSADNHSRPHTGLDGRTPAQRLGVTNLRGTNSEGGSGGGDDAGARIDRTMVRLAQRLTTNETENQTDAGDGLGRRRSVRRHSILRQVPVGVHQQLFESQMIGEGQQGEEVHRTRHRAPPPFSEPVGAHAEAASEGTPGESTGRLESLQPRGEVLRKDRSDGAMDIALATHTLSYPMAGRRRS